jgi:hypothetical protein
MKEIKTRAFVGAIGLLSAGLLAGMGCSSSNGGGSAGAGGHAGTTGAAGHAGTTGTAGTTGAAGTTGTAGTTGAGGSSSGLGCQTSDVAPGDPLIADFSMADGGAASLAIGGTFTYGPGPTAMVVGGAWNVTATSTGMTAAQYWGAGIYFNGNSAGTDCVNGAAHTGIQFDISGSVSGTGCTVQFSINDSEHSNNASDPKGAGDSTSYAPQLAIPVANITSTPTTMMVAFTQPTGGSPASAVDPTKLTGVQWQFTTAAGTTNSCMVDITIDNVKFY